MWLSSKICKMMIISDFGAIKFLPNVPSLMIKIANFHPTYQNPGESPVSTSNCLAHEIIVIKLIRLGRSEYNNMNIILFIL